jgi:hypothetical protein
MFYKKNDTTDRNNYRGILLLRISYNILINILLPSLSPYTEEFIVDHRSGFQCNRSCNDLTFVFVR